VTPPPHEPSLTRVALLLGTLVALTVVGSSAVAVALPVVAADLGLDEPGTAWVLAVFSLAFAVTTAIFGRMADIHGLRTPLRIGVVLFTIGSIAAALAWNFPSLIIGRIVQGMGAGAVPVLALGVLAARYDGVARGRALGALTAVVSIVSGSGPLIGGGVTELLGWRFVLGLPALALLVLEPVARIAPSHGGAGGSIDWRGGALVAAFTTGVVLLLQSPSTRPGPLLIATAAIMAAGGAVALRDHIRRRPEGLLPARVVGNRNIVLSFLAGMTFLAAYIGMILALPLILTAEQQWRPLQIGLAMLPAALLGAVVSRVVGGTAQRLGRYRVVVWLAAGSAAGLLLAGTMHTVPALMIVGFAAVVAGFAGGQVALVDGIPPLVDEDVQGVALGVFNLVFFTGGAVGSAVVGGLGKVVSLPTALICLGLLPFAGAILASFIRTGPAGAPNAVADDHDARDRLHDQP
jgi:MFS family permease